MNSLLVLVGFVLLNRLFVIFVLFNYFYEEKIEDTKEVIRIRKSKDRQYNGQQKKNKRTNNDLQNTSQKTKD